MAVMKVLLIFALVVAAVSAKVVQLTSDNFDEIVLDASKDVFVKFYAPWCGHCTKMAPAWEELAKKQESNDNVIIAELDSDAHRAKAQNYGVRGFPTIKLFSKKNKAGKDYQGGRDVSSFDNFLKANL
jgi:protein disulfide-isomerase-like protein